MNFILKQVAVFVGLFSLFFIADTVSAYVLLEPSVFSDGTTVVDNAGVYFKNLYQVGIGIAGVLAVAMLVFGGVEYIASAAVDMKKDAKDRMGAAILGLLLALLSWIVLDTINPDLTRFELEAPNITTGTVEDIGSGGGDLSALAEGETIRVKIYCYNEYNSDGSWKEEICTAGSCGAPNGGVCTNTVKTYQPQFCYYPEKGLLKGLLRDNKIDFGGEIRCGPFCPTYYAESIPKQECPTGYYDRTLGIINKEDSIATTDQWCFTVDEQNPLILDYGENIQGAKRDEFCGIKCPDDGFSCYSKGGQVCWISFNLPNYSTTVCDVACPSGVGDCTQKE